MRTNNFIKLALILSLCTQVTAFADTRTPVEITKITDGDTVVAQIGDNKFRVRLIGIDCYETSNNNRAYKQAYKNNLSIDEVIDKGLNSKLYLEKLHNQNKNSQTFLDFKGLDIYNRVLGVLYFGKINVNENLMQHGGCMAYPDFSAG